MNNWRYRLFQFMQGRYGLDEFGRFLLIVTVIVILLSNFRHLHFLYLAGLLLLVYTYFRIMSRNIFKRQRENQKYLSIKNRFTRKGGQQSNVSSFRRRDKKSGKWGSNENSQYNFYRCRNCGQVIRVPKGKGTLKITCPKCGNSFIDQT